MSAETPNQSRIIGFEMFACRALHRDLFFGVTDADLRKARVRAELQSSRRGTQVLCDLQGWETWACRFERIYGEEL